MLSSERDLLSVRGMRVVIIGRHGQLARALTQCFQDRGHMVVGLGQPALDLSQPDSIAPAFAGLPWRPDLVLNAAAYTAVDLAEDEAPQAYTANGHAPGLLAAAAAGLGAAFVHVSTDYVFDGRLGRPYREADPTNPLNVYGASKLMGEAAALAANPRTAILRTAWVCSPHGRNFLLTMLRLAQEGRPEVRVVQDQCGAPSFADDLARAMLAMAPRLINAPPGDAAFGIFHLTGAPHTTWHGFAAAIFADLAARGLSVPSLTAIATADYPTRATRPADGRLDCGLIGRVHGITPADWRLSLRHCLDAVLGPAQR